MRVLSLGWGVQSWTIAAMSALGDLPQLDLVIHSDTTFEHQATYEFARQWTPWIEAHGVQVVVVNDAVQAQKVMTGKTDIPAFTLNERTGDRGQLRRQCTSRWKIQPIRRLVTQELQRRELAKTPGVVEQWLGISLDEVERAKDSDVQYITNYFPLLETRMTRATCIAWLTAHGLPIPPKSSCVFCPYHNRRAWQVLKRAGGSDWQQAVAVDMAIRDVRPPYPLFVHPDRKPLAEAVKITEDFGYEQLSLIDATELPCDSGYCFV